MVLLLNTFERASFHRGVALCSAAGVDIGYVGPLPSPLLARSYNARGLRAAHQANDPYLLSIAFVNKGCYEHWSGDWAAAREAYAASAHAGCELGDIRNWVTATAVARNLFLDAGKLHETLSLAAEVLEHGEQAGDRLISAWSEILRGDALCRVGRLAAGEADLRVGLAGVLEANDLADVPQTVGTLAHCLLRQGRMEEAESLIEHESERLAGADTYPYFKEQVWTASAALRLARLEQATAAERETARRAAEQACRRLLKNSRLSQGGFVPGYRHLGTYHWLCGHRGKAHRAWQKSLAVADRLGARYQEAQTRLEIGRCLDDRAELERAEALFAKMGAALDLAGARRLLGKVPAADGSPAADDITGSVPPETATGTRA